MKFIVEYFEWIDVSISNSHLLCMYTTNENSGDKKDLKYLLQHRVPLLVWIGCGNHKLALCFKHLMGEYTNINDARCYLISFMEVFLLSSSGAKLLKRLLTLIKSRSLCQFVLWLLDGQPMGEPELCRFICCIEWKMGARSNGPICCPSKRIIIGHITFL